MEAKKIVITGAATRIGASIAKSLANFDVKILLHYNKSSLEVKKLKVSKRQLVKLTEEEQYKLLTIKKIILPQHQLEKILEIFYRLFTKKIIYN